MFIWLCLLAVTGIINITKYPRILSAFDPSRAVMRMSRGSYARLLIPSAVFVRTKDYDFLAGVLLALTGCEALFAK